MFNRHKTTRIIDPVSAAGCFIVAIWTACVLISLSASVVVIWAIIKLVSKYAA